MQLLFLLILKLISHVNTLINIAKAVSKPTIVLYQVMMALLLWRASSLPLQDNNNNTQKSTYKSDVYILKLKNIEIIIIISQKFITMTKNNQMNDQQILVAVIFYLLNKSAVMSSKYISTIIRYISPYSFLPTVKCGRDTAQVTWSV